MAKENVQIVLSADSAAGRKLFEDLANGLNRTEQAVEKTNRKFKAHGDTILGVAKQYVTYQAAIQIATQLVQAETEANNRLAESFKRVREGQDRIRVEGGLSDKQTAAVSQAVAGATQTGAIDVGTAQGIAQQMLEDRFSAEQVSGGGLEAMTRGIVGMNARGDGTPQALTRSISNIMQATGRQRTNENITLTTQELHGLLNATGMDLAGAEDLATSMGRASKPRMAKALASVGLKPEDIDPSRVGIGGAGQRLLGATGGMGEGQRAAFLSRILGDSGATGLLRGRDAFASGKVASSAGEMDADFVRATSGPMAESRRRQAMIELHRAQNGGSALSFNEAKSMLDADMEQRGAIGRGTNLLRGAGLDSIGGSGWWAGGIFSGAAGDAYKKNIIGAAQAGENRMRVELKLNNYQSKPGTATGTAHLDGAK